MTEDLVMSYVKWQYMSNMDQNHIY